MVNAAGEFHSDENVSTIVGYMCVMLCLCFRILFTLSFLLLVCDRIAERTTYIVQWHMANMRTLIGLTHIRRGSTTNSNNNIGHHNLSIVLWLFGHGQCEVAIILRATSKQIEDETRDKKNDIRIRFAEVFS